jgi:hypothetical protein
MAQSHRHSPSRRTRHESAIRRILVLDALRGMGATAIAVAAILILWVLFNAELMSVGPALTATALMILLILAHSGVRDFIHERTPKRVAVAVGLFACAWLIGLGWPLLTAVNPPPPLFVGELHRGSAPATVRLDEAGHYRVVVTGHLPAAADRSSHAGTYQLRMQDGGALDQVVRGEFTESWRMRRLGRRGSVSTRIAHSVTQHRIASENGGVLSLTLLDLSGDVGSSVSVEVFKQPVSSTIMTALGIVLTAGALAVDAWRFDVAHDGLMTIETTAALGGLAAFRAFGAAHAGFGDLFVNGLLGAIPGAAVGAMLWRAAGVRARTFLRRVK